MVPSSFIPATDPDGNVTAIRIATFPTNATNITLNGITYTSNASVCYNSNGCTIWPSGGVDVSYTGGVPTNPVHVYPANTNNGNNVVSFRYYAIDDAGILSPADAAVQIDFRTISLTGTVFHDVNNNRTQEASEGVYIGNNVTAVLVDPAGRVIEKVLVAANGTYTLNQVPLSTTGYKVILTAEPFNNITLTGAAPATSAPANWTYTGSNVNSGSTSAAVSINIPSSATALSSYNFGTQQIPTANIKTWTANRDANGDVFKGGSYYRLGLSDGEDVRLTGSDPEDDTKGSGATFIIKTLPSSSLAVLYYEDNNGIKQPISVNQTITNYDPAKMFVVFVADAAFFPIAQFNYAVVDNAGAESPAASYTISMPTVLPAIGLELSLNNTANGTVVNWQTLSEINTKHFVVERSLDGINYQTIATVTAAGNSNTVKKYSTTDADNNYSLAYYRVVLVDVDNKKYISNMVINRLNGGSGNIVSIYPNPAKGNTRLEFSRQGNYSIQVIDATGKLVQSHQLNAVNGSVFNITFKSKGWFIIKVTGNQTVKTFKVISE
ncbi:T9SS type A sorting domain-containing protein [Polluticaenibacter yanchengensis]|uniref:T9SS type A sorting domain-containing protein n=1 Tax=Polluticaenibacter yanchengensis TaxID=3014562 RepID=A0ABT4UPN8_9BACT|nr:T9SS type A sorting domain-containing protein [Chitinophagaceae bacterium LY-5]